jgi:hypothetical protein
MTNQRKTTGAFVLLGGLFLWTVGCGERYIPNTEIADNSVNRAVIDFCERYRHAVEDLNVGLLMSFASPRYFDNSGTQKGDDDMNKAGLEEALKTRFKTIKALRYEFKYRDVYEMHNTIMVEYTYNMSVQYEIGGETKWQNKTADNRLELERVDDGFLIVSGM